MCTSASRAWNRSAAAPNTPNWPAMLHAVGYRGFVSIEMRRAPLDDVRRAIEDIAEVFA